MKKWLVKFSTGGGPFPPYEIEVHRPSSFTAEEVIAFCNTYQQTVGSYYVAVSAILVEEDDNGI